MKKIGSICMALLLAASMNVTVFAASGRVIDPIPNEDNTVTFETGNETLAQLYFKADSDPSKFYVDLTTSWSESKFEKEFASMDAYLYAFKIGEGISARTTPTIYIYSPYDDDVEEKGYIYEEKNGKLYDVTDSFNLAYNSGGQTIYACRTATPGCYILSQQALDESLLSKPGEKTTRIRVNEAPQETKVATGLKLPSRS